MKHKTKYNHKKKNCHRKKTCKSYKGGYVQPNPYMPPQQPSIVQNGLNKANETKAKVNSWFSDWSSSISNWFSSPATPQPLQQPTQQPMTGGRRRRKHKKSRRH